MRFIHITDTHVAPSPEFAHYGHAPLANLEALVDTINSLQFPVDFVLHTGDVVEDKSEEAYRLARRALSRLRLPIYYVAGNHDDAAILQRVVLQRKPVAGPFDYAMTVDGVRVVVLDSRGPRDPSGTLSDEQISGLRSICKEEGGPLAIAIHHPPLPLDSQWLDNGWAVPDGTTPPMLLDRGPEFLDAIAPARERIRGVFFGHIHRAYQVVHRGVLFASAPSSFGQLLTWPSQAAPEAAPAEPAGFSLVTITGHQTIVRQHHLPRPAKRG
ncbi:MAG TPA: metallophosphoesterase [bacterium]|nr:metallophosphoesterase [bacterium]